MLTVQSPGEHWLGAEQRGAVHRGGHAIDRLVEEDHQSGACGGVFQVTLHFGGDPDLDLVVLWCQLDFGLIRLLKAPKGHSGDQDGK